MSENWYYQTLGMEFGPVEERELRKLAVDQIIGPDDLVRRGSQGSWISARQIPGLFETGGQSDGDTARTAHQSPSKESASGGPPRDSPGSQDLTRRPKSDREPPAAATDEGQWFVRVGGEEFGPLSTKDFLEIVQKGAVSPADSVRVANSSDWIAAGSIDGLFQAAKAADASTDESSFQPATVEKTRGRQPADEAEKAAAAAGTSPQAQHEVNASQAARDSLADIHRRRLKPKTGSKAKGSDQPGAVSQALSRRAEDVQERLELLWENSIDGLFWLLGSLRRLLGSKVMLGSVVCAVVAAALTFVDVPFGVFSGREDAYDVYMTVLEEARQMRSRQADKEQWGEFTRATRERLKPVVADLEDKADAGDRASLSLLWIGRDYLPRMLRDARGGPSESERQVDLHLEIVRETLAQQREAGLQISPADATMTAIIVADVVLLIGGAFWLVRLFLRRRQTFHG